jgi:oxidase EvaA
MKIINYLNKYKKKYIFKVKIKSLSSLNKWIYCKDFIRHVSNKFFQIYGFQIKSNFYKKKKWEQPLIVQKEVGILGIIKKKINNKYLYLLQIKMEPGNINKCQLSPTVQATKSNYTKAHGGKDTPYLNFFLNNYKMKKIFKIKLSEQSLRYYNKRNYNILLEDKNNIIKKISNYHWLNKKELKYLISKKNLINMDTLSVFSCAINKKKVDMPIIKMKKILDIIKLCKKKYFVLINKISLYKLKDWVIKKDVIVNSKKNYFSIIGISVKSSTREINEWEQPIIAQENLAFSGFITKNFNRTLHYLVSFEVKPALKNTCLSCTVKTSDINNYKKNYDLSIYKKNIISQFFIKKKNGKILYNKIQSDEGGRFFKSQIRYSIFQIFDNYHFKIKENYMWISHNQMIDFVKKKYFDIEARILFACYNLYKENID